MCTLDIGGFCITLCILCIVLLASYSVSCKDLLISQLCSLWGADSTTGRAIYTRLPRRGHTRMWMWKLTSELQCPNIVYLWQVLLAVSSSRLKRQGVHPPWMLVLVTLPAPKTGVEERYYYLRIKWTTHSRCGPEIHDPSHQLKSSLMQGAYTVQKHRTTLNPEIFRDQQQVRSKAFNTT